jgi:hypothetical protein
MPRETCTAPATLPLACTSGASRTSITRTPSPAIRATASSWLIRGTAAFAAASISFTEVGISTLPPCGAAPPALGQDRPRDTTMR